MFIYLIEYLCKEGTEVWSGKALVKAKNSVVAWEKFKNNWVSELEKGLIQLPISTITEHSVNKICHKDDVMF